MSATAAAASCYARADVTYLYDVAVIGGGIIGLATARELLRRGAGRVAVLERENDIAQHQTGRNSGVVHAGLYYAPGSLKAKLCQKGLRMTYDYVKKFGIPFKKVGKLVIATNPDEVTRLKKLFKNAKTNQVPKVRYIDNIDGIREIEPEATGLAAIHSPETGIVDWSQVAKSFSKDIHDAGGFVLCGHRMTDMQDNGDRVDIKTTVSYLDALQKSTPDPFTKIIEAKQVVSCAGTHADRVAQLCGGSREPQIVPVRGEYLVLPADTLLAKRIRGNIYPVPEPDVPFLGVHFTPTMSGDVIIGPNAVLAFSRNGYSNKYRDISVRDLYDMALYGGFWKAALRYGRYGMGEVLKSFYPAIAISNARRYVPALQASQVMHGGRDRCGVRAQAVGSKGDLIDDFVFERAAGGKVVHTRNAPSPGATSSMAIAEVISDFLGSSPVA